MQSEDIIKLEKVESTQFFPEQFLKYVLLKNYIVTDLIESLEQAIQQQIINDSYGQCYLKILKICLVLYNYYQLLQGRNFINDQEYFKMANALKKLFREENDYKQEIKKFQSNNSKFANDLRQELKQQFDLCLNQKNNISSELEVISKYLKDNKQEDLKFIKLKQQFTAQDQCNYDIYSYFFKLFYKQKWFKNAQQSIQLLKLQCQILLFSKLDSEYPLEFFSEQVLQIQRIKNNRNDRNIEYYTMILEKI